VNTQWCAVRPERPVNRRSRALQRDDSNESFHFNPLVTLRNPRRSQSTAVPDFLITLFQNFKKKSDNNFCAKLYDSRRRESSRRRRRSAYYPLVRSSVQVTVQGVLLFRRKQRSRFISRQVPREIMGRLYYLQHARSCACCSGAGCSVSGNSVSGGCAPHERPGAGLVFSLISRHHREEAREEARATLINHPLFS
jgi:hypothetical protein